MLIYLTTIILVSFTTIITGRVLQHIENNKICTSWGAISSSSSINIDTAPCSGSLGYELSAPTGTYLIRFCCPYSNMNPPGGISSSSECGQAAVSPRPTRIVGGQEAIPHSWPWLVSLQYQGNHFCGGTLIDEYHVLTAAHCLQDRSMFNSGMTVVAGLHARSQASRPHVQRKQIASITNHGGYNEETNENDVAIIRLASPVTFNSYVKAICLPGRDPGLNENVMIAGWGTTSYGGSSPDPLHQTNVVIMDLCKQVYHYDNNKQICAGNHQYTKDSCQGDSGGPLMHESNGKWILSGIVSYGDECAKLNRPGVYARVSHYLPWIRNVVASLSTA